MLIFPRVRENIIVKGIYFLIKIYREKKEKGGECIKYSVKINRFVIERLKKGYCFIIIS